MEVYIKVAGILLIALALIHIIFPKYFNWKKELISLSIMNRQMMYVHSFFIAFMVFLMGVLCITCSSELTATELGKKISLGLCLFWTVRLFMQFFIYSSKLWKGKRFETTIHILASIFWAYLSIIFFIASSK